MHEIILSKKYKLIGNVLGFKRVVGELKKRIKASVLGNYLYK